MEAIVTRDMTKLQAVEPSLPTAIRQWQATFDAVGAAIWLLDKDHRVLRCNRAAERLLNKEPVQIIGRPCWELVH